MDHLLSLLYSSFTANLFIPLTSEVTWFAWLNFDKPHLLAATIMALLASIAAQLVNFALGRLLARDLGSISMSGESYTKGQHVMRRYIFWLLLFPWIPFLGVFVLMAGFFHISWSRALILIVLSRMIYYGYYIISHQSLV